MVREGHVGYYLVDEGLVQLEATFAYRPRLIESFRRWCLRHPTLAYLGSLAWLTTLIIAVLVFSMYLAGASWPVLFAASLLALIPASDFALSILELGRNPSPRATPVTQDEHCQRYWRKRPHDGGYPYALLQRRGCA